MNIFLTGANGYIGHAFLLKVLQKGNKVFAVTRKIKNKKIKNVKWLIGPINKKWNELKKTDVLVHLAAEGTYVKYANFKKCYEFNVIKSEEIWSNLSKYFEIYDDEYLKNDNYLKLLPQKLTKYDELPDYVQNNE